ncbi:sucrase-isomaltase, intestinal-like [Amphiura filiformis]|uniref:sucrase-isomaltase, intestinal-like n=1 Tax=Amphiura filiformis TaxID=82378 RepID=UPI003B2105F4
MEAMDYDTEKPSKSNKKAIIWSVILTTLIVGTACVLATYFLHPDYGNTTPPDSEPVSKEPPTQGPPLEEIYRVECLPGQFPSEEQCLAKGCLYGETTVEGVPWCHFPENYGAYRMVGSREDRPWGFQVRLQRIEGVPSQFGGDIDSVILAVEYQTTNRLHFKFYDPGNQRFEVPLSMPGTPESQPSNPNYEVRMTENPFSLRIIRKATGTVLWDTSFGAFTFADQFLSISTKLPSSNVYGFGEHEHSSFRHDLNWRTWGMFSRDQPPSDGANLYGVHPFYMSLEEDTKAHGVFLLNSNAQEVSLQPTPALTYRTIGGVLDFYMFLGPTPENVVQQYTEAIGRPYLPPYWALGFQLCKYDYGDLDTVKEVVASMRQYDIPHDIQYGDIDYMLRQLDFTVNPDTYDGLGEFVKQIKEEGTRYIIILDPAIAANETTGSYPPYDEGVRDNVFLTKSNGDIMFGKVWPDYPDLPGGTCPYEEWEEAVENCRAYAAMPDFRKPATREWWTRHIVDFHDNQVEFDGIWIDMNEPASFVHGSVNGCGDNKYDNPAFKPRIWGPVLADKTMCMNAISYVTDSQPDLQYNMHSLYGWSQTLPSLEAAREAVGDKKRSFVVTRSTYPGSGRYAGHWLGDNTSRWRDMGMSIIGMMDFSLFGMSYTGADICGFFQDTTEALCRRWHQLGAFYPYSRNHNTINVAPQHPAVFGEDFALEVADVLRIRYRLLPFLYTLMAEAHIVGSTVVRPLMHEFTSDSVTWDLDRQFLWGPSLMVSPVLDEGHVELNMYVPKGPWYDYYTGAMVNRNVEQTWVTVPTPEDTINLHVRGGYIIPTQQPANSTMWSRSKPFGLIVALDSVDYASGNLFWDDGETVSTYENEEYYMVEFNAEKGSLRSTITHPHDTLVNDLVLDDIHIWGVSDNINTVILNGVTLEESKWDFDTTKRVFTLSDLNQPMKTDFILTWT